MIVVPPGYPTNWWGWVTDPQKPDWEILPLEAKPGEVILSKRHELGLLSNFAPTPFVFHGKRYASLEGFWQMMLYPESGDDPRATFKGLVWKHTRAQVAQMTADIDPGQIGLGVDAGRRASEAQVEFSEFEVHAP